MIRRPPRSTLFPTRRSSDLRRDVQLRVGELPQQEVREPPLAGGADQQVGVAPRRRVQLGAQGVRSEEHTSELQSRLHLVCRLLLEKKKKRTRHHAIIRLARS